ncbi:MAG: GntR family transcriptional regulator [Pseudomonadota bacterium]
MNIHQLNLSDRRRTTADEVFLQLRSDIISLRMEPGSKLSEAEVARRYDVSRQPVREAFMRLGELSLLEIRPQKATLVRKISLQDLEHTRFIRAAVEVEIVRVACRVASQDNLDLLLANLEKQRDAAKAGNPLGLQVLDYEFHRLICQAAEKLPTFKTISENKAHTDRVCTMELSDAVGMAEVLEDHTDIYEAIVRRDEEAAVALTRHHLEHLDDTLAKAKANHPNFFQD